MKVSESILVRKATSDDLPILFTICRESYSENFAQHWNEGGLDWYLDKVYGMSRLKSDLINPDINYFIAYVEDEPAGFMKLQLNSNLPNRLPQSGMEVEKLYFKLRYQGMGIGKKLMSIALEIGSQLKKEIIWLGVIDTNESAITFYKKMGFTIYDKTSLDIPYFKEELKGMWRMALPLR